jgi:hypothetical protein
MNKEFAVIMTAKKSHDKVNNANISEEDKRDYHSFINNFSELSFFSSTDFGLNETELDIKVKLPENLRTYRKILADVLFGYPMEMKFKSFIRSTPRADELTKLWYSVGLMGLSLDGDTGRILLDSNPDYSLIPIATVTGTPDASNYFLAMNSRKNDQKIYEFNLLDIFDTYNEGEPIDQSAYEVFDSYPQMLAHISEIKYMDGKKEIIVKAQES